MRKNSRRVTVGLVINNLDTEYQQGVWRGIEDAALARDVNVVVFEGGCVDPPHAYERLRNLMYDRISPTGIDGIIFATTTLGGFVGYERLQSRFSGIIGTIPSVSIGKGLSGISSVSTNNGSGLSLLLDHLVTVHNRRHFVYMGGFRFDMDAVERLETFNRVLARHGLEAAPDAIIQGDYSSIIAHRELTKWIALGHRFDAVVCANDEMAFGCYEALSEQGYNVPDQVSLTGFDDIQMSRHFTVPLTTIRQPIREIADRAFDILLDEISSGRKSEVCEFESAPVMRQSCGCLSRLESSDSIFPEDYAKRLEAAFLRVRDDPLATDDFLRLFRAMLLSNGSLRDKGGSLWNDAISRLGVLVGGGANAHACEAALHRARIMVQEFCESVLAGHIVQEYLRHRAMLYSVADFIGSFSLASLFDRLARSLPRLGVNTFYLSLFVPGSGGARSRLVFGFRDKIRINLPDVGLEFDTDDLFPREVCADDRRFSLCAEMLFYESVPQGMLVMDVSDEDIMYTDVLSRQIRGALRSSLIVDELVVKDEKLNQAFNQLSARANELERANELINENHRQLLAADKMASLGRLTASIAHEINTPLATVRASLSELGNLMREIRSSVGDPEVTGDDYRAIVSDMQRSLDLALASAEQASRYLRSVKNQTRDSSGDSSGVSFDAVPVVKDTVILLGHALRVGKCMVEIDEPETPILLYGSPSRLSQVVTNLVTNAIDAMSPCGGTIAITLGIENCASVIVVSDTGCGIQAEHLTRIFEPLFTTKPYGVGTGLGLSIVNDIVSGEFGGRIDVTSVPGKGSSFRIILPQQKNECIK